MDAHVPELPRFIHLANLSTEKLHQLETTLAFILDSPNAQDTYAQIIDGKATWQSHVDPNTCGFSTEKTIVSDHPKPSDGGLQLYREVRAILTPQTLKVELQVAQNYQNAPLGSREHDLRLLEITAASLNTLAGMIYAAFHPTVALNPPEPPSRETDLPSHETGQFYVDFYHTDYKEFEQYPFGLLNVVGYWAETQLFGGVLLFDRGESGLEINEAFLHPQRVSYAYQISSRQIACFSDLGKSENARQLLSAESPFLLPQEPNARIEKTWVRAGEAPLRVYKNHYDKPPPSYASAAPSCVQSHDEGLPVSFDEAMMIVKEEGWDTLKPCTSDLVALQNSQRCLNNVYSVEHNVFK